MKFWIKNALFICLIVLLMRVAEKNDTLRHAVKKQLTNIGLIRRVPNDVPNGLDKESRKNKKYLAKLKETYPLDKIPVPKMLNIKEGIVYKGCIGSNEYCESKLGENLNLPGPDVDFIVEKKAVAGFEIAETELTVEQWDVCVAYGGCQHMPDNYGWGRGDLPVVNVSWVDVQDYLKWLNSVTKSNYRLPTDVEWEYAAKAGSTTRFPWGDDLPTCEQVRHGSPNWVPPYMHICQIEGTWPVKSKQPNAWGLYHVIGNAAEWVQECSKRNASCDDRYNRGGNWCTEPETSILHSRSYNAKHRYNRVGLRLARDTH